MFWLRKRGRSSSPGENRIDALANRLQKEGDADQLESQLAQFDPGTLQGAERESWYHLRGIVSFHQGNRELAFERFQEGLRECPDSALILFSLGQEHEFRGETQEMFDCFGRALFPRVPSRYALAEARYAYLWGRTDRGWSYLEPLIRVYLDLKILDTTFLFIRGLPFFQQTWGYLAAFSQIDEDFGRLDDLTRRAESKCHDLDFEYLKAELEGFRSGDFSALKERLRLSIQKSHSANLPSGYQALRLNVLLAQESEDVGEANRILDSVGLASNDFPWLGDMRLLAKCQQAHRAGDVGQEAELRARFMARQPLLFEPDNAISFNLLRYQEGLKNDYRGARQRGR